MSAGGPEIAPRLRLAGAFDLQVLAGLHRAAFEDQPGAEIWEAAALAELLAMPGALALIVEAGAAPPAKPPAKPPAAPLGLALGRVAAEEAEVLTLGVCPAARRLGLGRALIDAMVARTLALGARRVFLEVAEDNKAARNLYAAAGFREVGCRPAYYRRAARSVDAVIMQLAPR